MATAAECTSTSPPRAEPTQFHGNVYEFFRNDKLNANQLLLQQSRRPAPCLPVQSIRPRRRRARREEQGLLVFQLRRSPPAHAARPIGFTVPTAPAAHGDFSQTFNRNGVPVPDCRSVDDTSNAPAVRARTLFPGNRIPANRINPISAQVIARIQPPTCPAIHLPAPTTTSARSPRLTTVRTTRFGSIPNIQAAIVCSAAGRTIMVSQVRPRRGTSARWSWRAGRQQPCADIHRA